MGRLTKKRDDLENDLQDVVGWIKELKRVCIEWHNDLCDTYNDSGWFINASQWLRKEVKTIIDWLDNFVDWADHYIKPLEKIYKLICETYDGYTEEDLASKEGIENYINKAIRRCEIAKKWYDVTLQMYENFGKILSGKYDFDVVSRLINQDNELIEAYDEINDEFDDNQDGFWVEKK